MPQTSATTPRISARVAAADPVDIATVRALWCALHPEASVRPIVDDLVAGTGGRPEVLEEAMRRLQSGRLERSTWVIEPALAVLEMARTELGTPAHHRGTNDPGAADPAGRTITP
jgi:hypothetical protein